MSSLCGIAESELRALHILPCYKWGGLLIRSLAPYPLTGGFFYFIKLVKEVGESREEHVPL
jgi:hypothetical protein